MENFNKFLLIGFIGCLLAMAVYWIKTHAEVNQIATTLLEQPAKYTNVVQEQSFNKNHFINYPWAISFFQPHDSIVYHICSLQDGIYIDAARLSHDWGNALTQGWHRIYPKGIAPVRNLAMSLKPWLIIYAQLFNSYS